MPRQPLIPGTRTVPANITVPESELDAWREHARLTDEGNVSRMLRRLVREDIRRFERTTKKAK